MQALARGHLGADLRIDFVTADADTWLTAASGPYDFAAACASMSSPFLDAFRALLSWAMSCPALSGRG